MATKTEQLLISSKDEADMIATLHDAAMSENEGKACVARALKEMLPVILRWQKAENDRDTSPLLVLQSATGDILISIAFTSICNLIGQLEMPEKVKVPLTLALVDRAKQHLDAGWVQGRARLEEQLSGKE